MKTSQVFDLIRSNRGGHEFIPTGFPKLDSCLDGGLLRKELVVIGGSTGAGKSYLAIHLADQASTAGFKVGYFSLEISNELVVARMVGMRSGLKASHILYGVQDGSIDYENAEAHVLGLGDLFDVTDTVYELQEMDTMIRQNGYEFVVIDFIQNVMCSRAEEYERLSHTSLHLQKLAKETNSCIVVLSQLSNAISRDAVENRPLEYKGSGSIATVADLGFFLAQRKDDLQINDKVQGYDFILAKNRRGPSKVMTQLLVRWPGGIFNEQN